jgi:hypothetical protein
VATPSLAQTPVADFYHGKSVHLLIGVNVGASFELEGRLFAPHISRFIPCNPLIGPQNTALCKVFYATMKDSDFIEEARRINIRVEATGGAEVRRISATLWGHRPGCLIGRE